MTNKRKVYNQLTARPKTPKTIGKAVGLAPVRTAQILQQLVKEGKAVHKTAGYVKGPGTPPPVYPPPTSTPPVQVKRSRWTNPPWGRKYVYVAWGLATGQFTPAQIAKRAHTSSCGAVAVQVTPENEPYQEQARLELHQLGMAYMIWERSDQLAAGESITTVNRLHPDAYLADVEGPMADQNWTVTFDKAFPDLPRALCATGALDQAYPGGAPVAELPWIANWDLCMQDYVVHGPNMTPEHGENFALWRNFPLNAANMYHWPVLEVRAEGSPSMAEQASMVAPWHGRIGVYTAEYLEDSDWQALTEL